MSEFPRAPIDCVHEEFQTYARVGRLTETEGGPVVGYALELLVRCGQCGSPFSFLGVPGGLSPDYPTASADATELRAPLIPGAQLARGPGIYVLAEGGHAWEFLPTIAPAPLGLAGLGELAEEDLGK